MKKILALSCLIALSGLFSASETLAAACSCKKTTQNGLGKYVVSSLELTGSYKDTGDCREDCKSKQYEEYRYQSKGLGASTAEFKKVY